VGPLTKIQELLFAPNVRLPGPIEREAFGFPRPSQQREGEDGLSNCRRADYRRRGTDIALRIAIEIRLCRDWYPRRTYFVGKTIVYSAGITIMSAFLRASR
jgi:hypothetical protein